MGYANSELVISVWRKVRQYVPKDERYKVLAQVMDTFSDMADWDCEDEIAEEFEESEDALKYYFKVLNPIEE